MFWLATHMWILLLTAFALGLGLGRWLWAGKAGSSAATTDSAGQTGTLALEGEASEPLRYPETVKGSQDDLTEIIGIDDEVAAELNEAGIYYYAQIAVWDRPQAKWVEDMLNAPGRVHNERWVEQAKALDESGPVQATA